PPSRRTPPGGAGRPKTGRTPSIQLESACGRLGPRTRLHQTLLPHKHDSGQAGALPGAVGESALGTGEPKSPLFARLGIGELHAKAIGGNPSESTRRVGFCTCRTAFPSFTLHPFWLRGIQKHHNRIFPVASEAPKS